MLENLKSKLCEIQKQKEQVKANYNALEGAEQLLLQLIKECEQIDLQDDKG